MWPLNLAMQPPNEHCIKQLLGCDTRLLWLAGKAAQKQRNIHALSPAWKAVKAIKVCAGLSQLS